MDLNIINLVRSSIRDVQQWHLEKIIQKIHILLINGLLTLDLVPVVTYAYNCIHFVLTISAYLLRVYGLSNLKCICILVNG